MICSFAALNLSSLLTSNDFLIKKSAFKAGDSLAICLTTVKASFNEANFLLERKGNVYTFSFELDCKSNSLSANRA